MIIGITGGSGCGKTTLLSEIQKLGGLVLDCDAIYHQLLATDKAMLAAIEARFPGVVENGQLNRKKLGGIVFSDESGTISTSSGRITTSTGSFFAKSLSRHTKSCPFILTL